MFIRRVVITAAALVSATTASAQVQEGCWQAHEVQAARVRDLQTLLMVGALECSAPGYDVAGHYNNFVNNNRSALAGHNDVLKVRFIREQGIAEGRRAYDAFATALANAHSGAAQATGSGFCQTARTLAALVQTAKPADLTALAETISERPVGVGETCADSGAPAPAPAVRPADPAVVASVAPSVVAEAAAPGTTAGASAVVPAPAPTPELAAGSAPVPTVTGAGSAVAAAAPPAIAAAPAAPTTAEALHAAALAIQSAAAALQAAAAQPATQPVAEASAGPAVVTPAASPPGVVIQPEPIVPPPDPGN